MRCEILRMEKVTYLEQDNPVLQNFDLCIMQREIMGLLPINHFGIATLLRLLLENDPIYYGYIYFRGKLINSWKESGAKKRTPQLSLISEESSLIEGQSVLSNIFVYQRGFRDWIIRNRVLEKRLGGIFKELSLEIDPRSSVESLGSFERIIVEIIRGITAGHSLMIFNELGAVLSEEELKKLYQIIRYYRERGISFLLISPHYEELKMICDRTAFLKDGQIMKIAKDQREGEEIASAISKNYRKQINFYLKDRKLWDKMTAFCVRYLGKTERQGFEFTIREGECLVLQFLDSADYRDFSDCLAGEGRKRDADFLLDGRRICPGRDRECAVIWEQADKSMLFPELSYMENLCFTMEFVSGNPIKRRRMRDRIRREQEELFGKAVVLKAAGELTKREKYALVYHRILLQRPKFVFCIQPFKNAGLAQRERIWELQRMLLQNGIALIIPTISMADSLSIADRIIRLHTQGEAEEWKRTSFHLLPDTVPFHDLYS